MAPELGVEWRTEVLRNEDHMRFVHEPTREFILLAMELGIFEQVPKRTTPEKWESNLRLLCEFCFTDATKDDLAEARDTSRPLVIYRLNKTLERLHANSPIEVQNEFPLETLDLNKDNTMIRVNKVAKQVTELKVQGLDKAAILDRVKINETQLSLYRTIGKDAGVQIPYLGINRRNTTDADLLEMVEIFNDPNTSDQEIQSIFDYIGTLSMKSYDKLIKSGAITTLSQVFNSEYSYSTRDLAVFISSLNESGENVPQGVITKKTRNKKGKAIEQRRHFVLARHERRILDAVSEDERLAKHRKQK